MDPLSDVLRAVRLNGAYFYPVEAAAPWSVSSIPASDLRPRILPDAEHLISYHILVSGTCWGGIEGEPQRQMFAGDIIVFPLGDPHVMSSAAGERVADDRLETPPPRFPTTAHLGPEDRRDAMLVCGFLGCDARPCNPLLTSLPRTMLLRGAAEGWLSQFPLQVVAESREGRFGSETMLTRMAELMFIEVVRRHVEKAKDHTSGWLAGLTDPVVGPALTRIHERPDSAWTLADLAQEVGASRTVLAERFTQIVGISPMLYLTRWRLQLASEKLLRGSAKVADIGADVGYESEAAFSRAFKREMGAAPAVWRKMRLETAA